jgi:hypothetical protein
MTQYVSAGDISGSGSTTQELTASRIQVAVCPLYSVSVLNNVFARDIADYPFRR